MSHGSSKAFLRLLRVDHLKKRPLALMAAFTLCGCLIGVTLAEAPAAAVGMSEA